MVGGSAKVYDELARNSDGHLIVLTAGIDYKSLQPLSGARAFDAATPYTIIRIPHLRPPLYEGPRSLLQRVGRKLRALTLRLTVLNQIRQIVRAQKIDVVCIGELEANGWLAPWCRRLFGVPTMIYVHGEEVNRRTNWRNEDATRQKSLRAAAAIIAVSRYTQDIICQKYHIERDRVHLVPNAVDAGRFAPSQ